MANDFSTTPRTRRGLLAAGVAAAAAAAAASVTRISPASAADGDPAIIGSTNEGATTTVFSVAGAGALVATSDTAKGLEGTSTSGQGVHGSSSSSAGVSGVSDEGNGVHGTSTSSRGVYGESTSGPGVVASSGSAAALVASSTSGPGVNAASSSGSGVVTQSTSGYALETTAGAVKFSGLSGIAVIPAGKEKVTVAPGVPIGPKTIVLLSPEVNLGSKGLWYKKPGTGTEITIHLSASRGKDTPISYMVIDHG